MKWTSSASGSSTGRPCACEQYQRFSGPNASANCVRRRKHAMEVNPSAAGILDGAGESSKKIRGLRRRDEGKSPSANGANTCRAALATTTSDQLLDRLVPVVHEELGAAGEVGDGSGVHVDAEVVIER